MDNTAANLPEGDLPPEIIRAAQEAIALDQRIGTFVSLTILVNFDRRRWSLTEGILRNNSGGFLVVPLLVHPPEEGNPFAEQAAKRIAAAERLRDLLAEIPFTGGPLRIPLV
ncbi:MAG: hypothetical protein HOY79_33820 [Streptomyces sp.]|nr:hypothetical protein [Streptomyces sp.]NUS11329.1 hypothetical protein [Streptomyces sp.]NUS23396.1 hypothetical protein [Streptomyces sp.]